MTECNMCGSASAKPLFRAKGYDLVRCVQCDLAYVSNPPDENALRKLYSAGRAITTPNCMIPAAPPHAGWLPSRRGT
ncbi:hypothetical protein ACFSLT_15535 [Novosphingobium resinovorum]